MYIKIRVKTEQKEERVIKVTDTHYTISVKEPAEHNLANRRILEVMKDELGTPHVRIISGHHSPSKIIAVGD